jgi:hypothetical protein
VWGVYVWCVCWVSGVCACDVCVCVCVCVTLVTQHTMRMNHIDLCCLPRSTILFHII